MKFYLESLIELVNYRGSLNAIIPTLEECYYLYSKGIVVTKKPNDPYFCKLTLEQ